MGVPTSPARHWNNAIFCDCNGTEAKSPLTGGYRACWNWMIPSLVGISLGHHQRLIGASIFRKVKTSTRRTRGVDVDGVLAGFEAEQCASKSRESHHCQ